MVSVTLVAGLPAARDAGLNVAVTYDGLTQALDGLDHRADASLRRAQRVAMRGRAERGAVQREVGVGQP